MDSDGRTRWLLTLCFGESIIDYSITETDFQMLVCLLQLSNSHFHI
jgi:hypothetical protein